MRRTSQISPDVTLKIACVNLGVLLQRKKNVLRMGIRMKRRNVLGNQMESSKTAWIVIIGMLTTVLQFVIYYFVSDGWPGILLTAFCILLGSILVHFITGELEELFSYLLIPCVASGSVALLLPQMKTAVFPESNVVYAGCLLAWLVPTLYSCVYTWAEGSTALSQFSNFYKKSTIFFFLVYFCMLIYWFVAYSRIPTNEITAQFIPFATFAAYIDGVLSGTVLPIRIFWFLAERIILFLPYGFFVAMAGRKLHGLFRLGLVFAFPMVIELLQYILKLNSFDADDIAFSFLGGLIGILCFVIFNALFQKTTGKNFDGSELERDYYGRRI